MCYLNSFSAECFIFFIYFFLKKNKIKETKILWRVYPRGSMRVVRTFLMEDLSRKRHMIKVKSNSPGTYVTLFFLVIY